MNHFSKYIDEAVEQLQQEENYLASTDRKDESNLVKIQINGYGICKTIYQVFAKTKAGNVLKDAYLEKLDSLAAGWQEAHEKAKEFDAVEKAVIEEIKLQTIDDIRNHFIELWEES